MRNAIQGNDLKYSSWSHIKCDPILEKMVKGGEKKNEFFRVLIENPFKRRLNGFNKRLNEFQKR